MADTWGEIISRNYLAGRAMANDFVTSRFTKKADEVRSKYEQRAKDEGKLLQDYLPDLENELRTLATGVGATRRGVTDGGREGGGSALDVSAMGRIREDVARSGDQRAGVQAMNGDQVGARKTRAGARYAIGNFDEGQGQQIAGDTIAATSGALNDKGVYDPQKGALGLAKVGAQYGNGDTAAAQTEQADTFRMKSAAAKATQLYNLIDNGGKIDNDQFVGLWEGIKQDLPEFKNVDLRLVDGKVYIYENGHPNATGDLDSAEAARLLQAAIQAPGQAINSSMQAQIKAIEDSKAAKAGVDDVILKAQAKVITDAKAAGVSPGLAAAVVEAQNKMRSSGTGLQFKEIGTEPNQFIVESNGKAYVVKTNQPVAGLLGAGGATDAVKVYEVGTNTEVPPAVLNKMGLGAGGDMTKLLIDIDTQRAKAGTAEAVEFMNLQLNGLNNLGHSWGGSSARVDGGGGRFPIKETDDYVRKILSNAGEVPEGDSRSKAKFLIPFLVKQESGGDHSAVSPKGAIGVTQVMPKTGKDPGFGVKPLQNESREEYLRFGEDYLTAMLDKYGGDPALALAAYNAGPGVVDGWAKGGGTADTAIVAQPKGALPTSAPGAAKEAALPNATAQSAPAAQTAVPGGGKKRAAIDEKSVRGKREELLAKRDDVLQKQEKLKQFDADYGTKVEFIPGRGLDSAGVTKATNLPPAAAEARERLIEELATLQDELRTLTAVTRTSSAVLDRDTAGKERDRIVSRYGGSADFYKRAADSSAGSR